MDETMVKGEVGRYVNHECTAGVVRAEMHADITGNGTEDTVPESTHP